MTRRYREQAKSRDASKRGGVLLHTRQTCSAKLDSSPVKASLARTLARKFGYSIEEGLVLPASGMPSVNNLRSLLANPITAPNVERLIAAHPDWGFWIDASGEIQDF